MSNKKKYKKLGLNIFAFGLSSFSSKILMFLFIPFYTSILSTSEYGSAAIIVTTVSLITPLFTLIISEAVMRFALDSELDKKQIFTIGLGTNFAGFLLLICFTPIFLSIDIISDYYLLFIFYFLTFNLFGLISQFLKGLEKIKLLAINSVLSTILIIGFNIIFLLVFELGIEGYLLSSILSFLITSISMFLGAKLSLYIISPKNIDFKLAVDMFRYTVPMIPNSLSWWVSNSSDRYILTAFKGVAINGLYSVAYKLPSFLTVFTGIFMKAWQISAVEDFGTPEGNAFFSKVYNRYVSINIIISSGVILFTKLIALILFKGAFYEAWIYGPVLILAFQFNSLGAFLGTIYTSAKKTKMLFISTSIGALLNVTLNFLLIPLYGGIGAAVATAFSYFIIWLIRLIDTKKILNLKVDLKKQANSYMFLIIEVFLICSNSSYSFVISFLIVLYLFALNHDCIFR